MELINILITARIFLEPVNVHVAKLPGQKRMGYIGIVNDNAGGIMFLITFHTVLICVYMNQSENLVYIYSTVSVFPFTFVESNKTSPYKTEMNSSWTVSGSCSRSHSHQRSYAGSDSLAWHDYQSEVLGPS